MSAGSQIPGHGLDHNFLQRVQKVVGGKIEKRCRGQYVLVFKALADHYGLWYFYRLEPTHRGNLFLHQRGSGNPPYALKPPAEGKEPGWREALLRFAQKKKPRRNLPKILKYP